MESVLALLTLFVSVTMDLKGMTALKQFAKCLVLRMSIVILKGLNQCANVKQGGQVLTVQ